MYIRVHRGTGPVGECLFQWAARGKDNLEIREHMMACYPLSIYP